MPKVLPPQPPPPNQGEQPSVRDAWDRYQATGQRPKPEPEPEAAS